MTSTRAPSFPPVDAALVAGAGPDRAAAEFLDEVDRWRRAAEDWLAVQARRGRVSGDLLDLLRWSLGRTAAAPPRPGPYALTPFPAADRSAPESAVAVLVWRSGLADFLADVWDVVGPAPFGLEECALVLDELLTPDVLRGVLACPDCLQVVTSHPELAGHTAQCPIRRLRLGDPR